MPVFEVDTAAAPMTYVRFSNGTINRKDLPVSVYRKRQRKSSDGEQIVTAHIDGNSYVGQNFGPANRFPEETCKYYMGIHDRTTGMIRVVPASLIQMEPWFEEKEDDASSLMFNSKTMKEKHDAVASEFGSVKDIRAIRKRQSDKLDEGMVATTAQNIVDGSSSSTDTSGVQELQTLSDAIPPHNADATRPDDVYKLKDLISKQVLESLKEASTALSSATDEELAAWRSEKKYFTFVLDKLGQLSTQPAARTLQVQCLLYLQYLMEMYQMNAHLLKKKYPLPKEWPQAVRDHMLGKFTLEMKEPGKPTKRLAPTRLRDLMLSHILVMCLKMCDFSVDLTHLITDLKHTAKKLTRHASLLGCSSQKSKRDGQEVYTVVLKLPLTFPTVRDKVAKNRIF